MKPPDFMEITNSNERKVHHVRRHEQRETAGDPTAVRPQEEIVTIHQSRKDGKKLGPIER